MRLTTMRVIPKHLPLMLSIPNLVGALAESCHQDPADRDSTPVIPQHDHVLGSSCLLCRKSLHPRVLAVEFQ